MILTKFSKLYQALSADYSRSYNEVNFISCCASAKNTQPKSTPTLNYALKNVVKMMYSLTIEMQPRILENRYGNRIGKSASLTGMLDDDDGSV